MAREKSEQRKIFEERVKYLVSTDYLELKEDDKINKILIKIILSYEEYCLLNAWYKCNWNISKLSKKIV